MSTAGPPTTPVKQIIQLRDESPISSTLSTPEIVLPTEIANPFEASGPIIKPNSPSSSTDTLDEDEDDGDGDEASDDDSESDVIELEPQITKSREHLQQTDGVTHNSNNQQLTVRAPASAPRLFSPQEVASLVTRQGRTDKIRRSRASSAPPEVGEMDVQVFERRPNYVLRYHQKLLPPPEMPVHSEILAYTQRWGYWATMIDDRERRSQVINKVCEKIQAAWSEGMKKALIPAKAPEGHEQMSPAELQQALEEELARQQERKKAKRQPSPSRAVIIEIRRNIHSDATTRKQDYSISAGQLVEAGVNWQNVKRRVKEGDLDTDRVLINRIMTGLGIDALSPRQHWIGKVKATRYNPHKRDLFMFCLWEVFRSDSQLLHLKEVLEMLEATHPNKQEAQEALESEQKLRNQLMAVALELDPERETEYISSDEDDDDEPIIISGLHTSDKETSGSDDSGPKISKKHKLETPAVSKSRVNASELLPVASMSSNRPDILRKQQAFISEVIRPKANQLLEDAGLVDDLLDETTDRWPVIYEQFQEASIDTDKINGLIQEINARFAQIEVEDSHKKKQDSVIQDVEGYPSRLDIWRTIPPEGYTPEELAAAFPEVRRSDSTWHALVKSVAEIKDGRFIPTSVFDQGTASQEKMKDASDDAPRSLRVTLKLKSTIHDPEHYALDVINNTQGFKWRYLSTSTVKQRLSMDNAVEDYVKWRIDTDKGPNRVHRRYGTHELLGDPENLDGPAIVHGVWDMHRKTDTKTDRLVWFEKKGDLRDGEVTDMGFTSYDPVPQGSMEEILEQIEVRKREQLLQSQQQPQLQAQPTGKTSGGRGGKRGSTGRGGGVAGGRAGQGSAQSTPTRKPRKRKAVKHDVSDLESPRVKRRAARRQVNYVEEAWDDDDDDGYEPVDSD